MSKEESLRVKEGLNYANKIVTLLKVIGIPYEFGYKLGINGIEYTVDVINSIVTVQAGENYQLVANVSNKQVTVCRGQTWIRFMEDYFIKHIEGKENEELKNLSNYRLLQFMGIKN